MLSPSVPGDRGSIISQGITIEMCGYFATHQTESVVDLAGSLLEGTVMFFKAGTVW